MLISTSFPWMSIVLWLIPIALGWELGSDELYYTDVSMNGLYLNQQIVSNPDDCVLCDAIVREGNSALLVYGPEAVGADAGLQKVQIGNITGKFYTGVRLDAGEWDPLPDLKYLRWQVDRRAFKLISLGTDLQTGI